MLEISELEELRLDAYDSLKDYKARTKIYHDKFILRRTFNEGDRVLLFSSRLRLMPGKLRSRWTGPYTITKVFPHGAIELKVEGSGHRFKVNGQRVKHYHGEPVVPIPDVTLEEPTVEDAQVVEFADPDAQPVGTAQHNLSVAQPVAQLRETAQDDILALSDVEYNNEDPDEPTYEYDPTEPTYDEDAVEDVASDAESRAPIPLTGDNEDPSIDNVVILRPPKEEKDSEAFVFTITLGGAHVSNCLLDSGASRSIMSEALYRKLDLPPLLPHTGSIWFGNHEDSRPVGLLRTTIFVEGYPIPCEFLVIKGKVSRVHTLILGRPFLSTTKACMSFDSTTLTLTLPNAMLMFDTSGRLLHRCMLKDTQGERTQSKRPRMNVRPSVGGRRTST